jgi:GNAT superfamily N-acetyltransferase
MLVREATSRDVPAMLEGVRAFASIAYPGEPMRVDHVANVLRGVMENQDGLVALMETDEAAFAGMFVAIAHRGILTGARTMGEVLFYVDPQARGHGKKLLNFAEEWARERGCERATLCHLETTPNLETAYRRWGYAPLERAYMKELT